MKNIKIIILILLSIIICSPKISNLKITAINNNQECQYNLTINSINFRKCLYDTASKYNSLKYGLEVFYEKPLVILGHSGTKDNAVFNDLIKVNNEDVISINYPNHKNEKYIINKKYEKNKKDNLILEEDLILVTCSRENLSKQIVIVASIIR